MTFYKAAHTEHQLATGIVRCINTFVMILKYLGRLPQVIDLQTILILLISLLPEKVILLISNNLWIVLVYCVVKKSTSFFTLKLNL